MTQLSNTYAQVWLAGKGLIVKLRLHGTRQAARLRRDSRAANIKT